MSQSRSQPSRCLPGYPAQSAHMWWKPVSRLCPGPSWAALVGLFGATRAGCSGLHGTSPEHQRLGMNRSTASRVLSGSISPGNSVPTSQPLSPSQPQALALSGGRGIPGKPKAHREPALSPPVLGSPTGCECSWGQSGIRPQVGTGGTHSRGA